MSIIAGYTLEGPTDTVTIVVSEHPVEHPFLELKSEKRESQGSSVGMSSHCAFPIIGKPVISVECVFWKLINIFLAFNYTMWTWVTFTHHPSPPTILIREYLAPAPVLHHHDNTQ